MLPSFIFSASSRGMRSPSAISLVISVEPIGKTSRDTGLLSSKTTIDTVSEPMFASTHPATLWVLLKVTKLAAIGAATMSITSTPVSSTASTKSLR